MRRNFNKTEIIKNVVQQKRNVIVTKRYAKLTITKFNKNVIVQTPQFDINAIVTKR